MGRGVNNQGRNQFPTYSYRSKDTPPAPPSIVPSCSRINRARWLIENRETNEERLPYGTPPCLNFVSTGLVHPFRGIRVIFLYEKVRDIVLGKLRYTNRGRRAWYPLRGWWYRSSPDRNIVPRQRLSPSARKSSGSRSPDTGWSGSRHLAKDRPCCPCTCNRQSANRLLLSKRKKGETDRVSFLLEKYNGLKINVPSRSNIVAYVR